MTVWKRWRKCLCFLLLSWLRDFVTALYSVWWRPPSRRINRRGLRGSPCFTPPNSAKVVVLLFWVRHALTSAYIAFIIETHCGCKPIDARCSKSLPLWTLSNAPLKSMKQV
jgi:hypothetical protein